jgi:4-hydroxy-tetrahydrodipicolinate reductase
MLKVGLVGYGKAGKAVAQVLDSDPRFELCWIFRRQAAVGACMDTNLNIPVVGLDGLDVKQWLDENPVDAIVDFSNAETVFLYGEEVQRRGLMLVTAISAYAKNHIDYLMSLSSRARVMSSPNITLGINFLLMSAKFLRDIAPFADVEIVEQHFREKAEISGTARKLAESLDLEDEKITSLRIGGIVGHHEVIFGFPHQTVRLIHDSIRREAFGTGAAFALMELEACEPGFYSFDDLLMKKIRNQIMTSV